MNIGAIVVQMAGGCQANSAYLFRELVSACTPPADNPLWFSNRPVRAATVTSRFPNVGQASATAGWAAFTKFLKLNLPCYHPLAAFLPRLGLTLMLLLNRVRSCARRNLPNPNLLASKRCFSGGTDTSRRL
jgi:hypothetical protein